MQTIADRLTEARKRRKRSIRSVQQELDEAGVSGSSYPNVHGLFSGKTTPGTDFIEAVARVLDHRPAWLAFGSGEPTKEQEEAARREGAAVDQGPAVSLLNAVLRGMAPYPTPDGDGYLSMADPNAVDASSARVNLPGIPVWLAPLSEVCRRTGLDGEGVGRLLAAPLKEARVRLLSLKGDALTDYIMAMIPALLALADYVSEPKEGSDE
jgi:hypothetical protein